MEIITTMCSHMICYYYYSEHYNIQQQVFSYKAVHYINEHSLKFNPHKTKCSIYGRNSFNVTPQWDIEGNYLEVEKGILYLGTTLNANDHVNKRDLEKSDHLQFGPVVSLENSDYLLENSDHSWRTRPVRLENSDYYQIYVSNN